MYIVECLQKDFFRDNFIRKRGLALFWGVQKIQNMRSPTKSGVPKAGVICRQSTSATARIQSKRTV
jgi:hypothetical protein